MTTKRLFRVKYLTRVPSTIAPDRTRWVMLAQPSLQNAVPIALRLARKRASADSEQFIRLVSVKDQGVLS